MKFGTLTIGAALLLGLPVIAGADEALDAARSEMTTGLGAVPPFIAVLPEGAQPGAWALLKGNSGNPGGEIPGQVPRADRARGRRAGALRLLRLCAHRVRQGQRRHRCGSQGSRRLCRRGAAVEHAPQRQSVRSGAVQDRDRRHPRPRIQAAEEQLTRSCRRRRRWSYRWSMDAPDWPAGWLKTASAFEVCSRWPFRPGKGEG